MTSGGSVRTVQRLHTLTSLRFFAAALVLLHHAFYLLMPDSAFARATSVGYMGVGFFFTLSGFILMWTYSQDLPVRNFYGRRVARIYPMHLLTAVLAVVLLAAAGNSIPPAQSILNIFLLQSWVPVESFGSSLNGVSWSLCCEAFFYLCFPFIARWSRNWNPVIAAGIVGAAMLAAAAAVLVTLPVEVAQQVLYKGPAFRIGGFILGILLAVWIRRGGNVRVSMPVAGAFFALTYLAAAAVDPGLRVFVDLFALPSTVLLIAAAVRSDQVGGSAWLRRPWLVRLGEASFALYMTHYLLLQTYLTVFGAPSGAMGIVAVTVMVALAVAVSVAFYTFFEHPAEKMLRRAIGTPRQPSRVVPAESRRA